MYCSNCGKKLSENDFFCSNCGTPVSRQNLFQDDDMVNSSSNSENDATKLFTYEELNQYLEADQLSEIDNASLKDFQEFNLEEREEAFPEPNYFEDIDQEKKSKNELQMPLFLNNIFKKGQSNPEIDSEYSIEALEDFSTEEDKPSQELSFGKIVLPIIIIGILLGLILGLYIVKPWHNETAAAVWFIVDYLFKLI